MPISRVCIVVNALRFMCNTRRGIQNWQIEITVNHSVPRVALQCRQWVSKMNDRFSSDMWFLYLLFSHTQARHMHYDMKTRVHSTVAEEISLHCPWFCWIKSDEITDQENKDSTKAETVMWIIDMLKYAAYILCFVAGAQPSLGPWKLDEWCCELWLASPIPIYCFYLFSFRAIINSADSIILFYSRLCSECFEDVFLA